MATLPQALRRSKTSLVVPGTSLQGVVRTERHPLEMANPEVVDSAPPGHVMQLVWERLPQEDERETAELPDVDPRLDSGRPRLVSYVSWTRQAWRTPTCVGSMWARSARTTPSGTSSR